jgi:hypothetical protein
MSEPNLVPDAQECPINSLDGAALRFKRKLQEELKISQRQAKAVAIDMGIDPAQLTRWLGDGYRDQMPAHMLPAWVSAVGSGLWLWIENDIPEAELRRQTEETKALALLLAASQLPLTKLKALENVAASLRREAERSGSDEAR